MKLKDYSLVELHRMADSVDFTIEGLKISGIKNTWTMTVLGEFHKLILKNIGEKKNARM